MNEEIIKIRFAKYPFFHSNMKAEREYKASLPGGGEMNDEQVTPNRERGEGSKRTYIRNKKTITCFMSQTCNAVDYDLIISDTPLFELKMSTIEGAVLLMNDLYYGEYTGA